MLDITGIEGLRQITRDPSGITIGATATWSDIIAADLPPACDGLKLAACEVGARQIQNQGTIAGNLCNASPAADGVPPLLTLDAAVVLQSTRGERCMPLDAFLIGPRQTARADDELLTAIRIPAEALQGQSHFLKLGARHYLVISIAMVAARLSVEDGIVRDAAVAVGACGPVAARLPEVEDALKDRALDTRLVSDDLVLPSLSPIDDVRADAVYRLEAATELVKRCVANCSAEKVA